MSNTMSGLKTSPPSIVYSIGKADEVDEILDVVYKYFLMREPTCACVNLIKDPSERIEIVDNFVKMTIMENLTIVAKDKLASDKIVGKS